MISIRTNQHPVREVPAPVHDALAPLRHHPKPEESQWRGRLPLPAAGGSNGGNGGDEPPPFDGDDDAGDIIYGAQAIADYLFPEEPNRRRARRRVFNAWAYYKYQKDRAGFFKFKGALCLSKRLWRKFHGRG